MFIAIVKKLVILDNSSLFVPSFASISALLFLSISLWPGTYTIVSLAPLLASCFIVLIALI